MTALMHGIGSTRSLVAAKVPLGTSSKCKSGPPADPLIPEAPMVSPTLTVEPTATATLLRKPYKVLAESEEWRTMTYIPQDVALPAATTDPSAAASTTVLAGTEKSTA